MRYIGGIAREMEMDHRSIYDNHISQPYGEVYADRVRRFQDGFLRDRVCKGPRRLDDAFERAVETCERLLPVIRMQAA